MMKPPHIVLAVLLGSLAAHSATGKEIRLLDGRLSFTAPLDLTPSPRPPKHSERYAALLDLASADRSFSLLVTYGRHSFEAPDVAELLREKVAKFTEYTSRSSNLPHFRWIHHRVIERDGRQWADICFSHDNDAGAHVYTRCVSCFVRGRTLEILALTRRATELTQKTYVDRLIDSIHLTS